MIPSLSIVIVNWNSGTQLATCLHSLLRASKEGFALVKIIVVDNASSDGSADFSGLEGLPLHVVHSQENMGYGRACNVGARSVQSDFLLFLNPDVRLAEGSLHQALMYLSGVEASSVGILGVQLINERGEVQRSCSRFPTLMRLLSIMTGLEKIWPGTFQGCFMSEWDHAETRYVDQVMGAFFLVRRTLFDALHGFDERFFLYFEEVDFAFRAQRIGMKSLYFTGARAYHRGGGSSDAVRSRRLFYNLRSRMQFACKHFSMPAAFTVGAGTLVVEPIVRAVRAAARLSWDEFLNTAEASVRLWRFAIFFPLQRERVRP